MKHEYLILILAIVLGIWYLSRKQLILFYSDNCSYCKAFKPVWKDIQSSGLVSTSAVNCGGGGLMCKWYGIQALPTIMVTKGFTQYPYKGERTKNEIIKFYQSI
jgi:thiol-disulfide isomerase/thioredoxin